MTKVLPLVDAELIGGSVGKPGRTQGLPILKARSAETEADFTPEVLPQQVSFFLGHREFGSNFVSRENDDFQR